MMSFTSASAADLPSGGDEGINAELWHACAGPDKTLPPVNSEVAYFPQGHIEQVASFNNQGVDGRIPRYNLSAVIPCALNDIQLGAELETDEVFATLNLCPISDTVDVSSFSSEPYFQPKRKSKSFTKTLTVSDTSTHGGFSVPRRAAEECLPSLDKSQDPPTQELVAKDLHGKEWKFRHIFRGQPKRHLLTTGWSVFVSKKRLAAGDSVVFLRYGIHSCCTLLLVDLQVLGLVRIGSFLGRGENGKLWIGVRRAPKQQQQSKVLTSPTMALGVLASAAHAATEKCRFTVVYNPRSCPSEFIIPLRKYVDAMKHNFTVGQRFKMKFESEDSADRRCTGTITGISDFDPVGWPSSGWRSLQVSWDDSSPCERPERISPWEIEPFTGHSTILMQVGTRRRPRPPAHSYKADHALGTNQVGTGSPHCQSLGLSTFVHGGLENKGLPVSLNEEADSDEALPSQRPWNVKCEDGSEVEDRIGSNRLPADCWLQMRRPAVLHGDTVIKDVMDARLQNGQGTMGIGRSKPEHCNFGVQQVYGVNERCGGDPGTTLQPPSSTGSSGQSLVKHRSFSDADLQFRLSSTLTEYTGTKLSNVERRQQSLPVVRHEESHGDCWVSSLGPLLEVNAPSAVPSRLDLAVGALGDLPPILPGSSSYPSTPKSNNWVNWTEVEADRNFATAPLGSEKTCKIFGVPFERPAMVTVSSQSYGSEASCGLEDVVTHTNSTCIEKTNPDLELAGQNAKGIQGCQSSPMRSFTKVHRHGAVGRSIDVTKFDGYDELLEEVEGMFGLKGELFHKKSGWQLVYTDHEEDVLLVGDDPWMEFCSCVRSIRVLSPGEVSPASRSTG